MSNLLPHERERIPTGEPLSEERRQQLEDLKSGKIGKMKYRFFSDPGHSWLEVSFEEIAHLGLQEQITAWSYIKGPYLYLEEDYDAPLFLQAKKHAGEVVEYVEVTADYNSPVRGYNHYYMGTGFED